MWLSIGNNEMWNLDNVEGITVEDNLVILVYPNHCERFEAKSGVDAESVLCDIEVALKTGQKIFNCQPDHLKMRDEMIIFNRFG